MSISLDRRKSTCYACRHTHTKHTLHTHTRTHKHTHAQTHARTHKHTHTRRRLMDPSPHYTSEAGKCVVGAGRNDPATIHYDMHTPASSSSSTPSSSAAPLVRGRVVCVMGLLTDGIQWWPQIESFAANGYQVITFDNRGVGRSAATRPPYTTGRLAEDALELLAAIGWVPSEVHLAGVVDCGWPHAPCMCACNSTCLALASPANLAASVRACSFTTPRQVVHILLFVGGRRSLAPA